MMDLQMVGPSAAPKADSMVVNWVVRWVRRLADWRVVAMVAD